MLKIVNAPHKVLTTATRKVIKFDKKLAHLIKEMKETLAAQKDPQGVGLAAPQVGIDLALFIMKPYEKAKVEVIINPRIIEIVKSESTSSFAKASEDKPRGKKPGTKLEGCLSVPKIWSPLTRPTKVILEYQDMTGAVIQRPFSGFEATIVQHEIDHLQGILFTQRALEQKSGLFEEHEGELKKINY